MKTKIAGALILASLLVMLQNGCGRRDTAENATTQPAALTHPEPTGTAAAIPENRVAAPAPGEQEQVSALIGQLADEDTAVRAESIYQLGQLGAAAVPAIMPLIEILAASDSVVVPATGSRMRLGELAAESLGNIGKPALPALLNTVTDQNTVARNNTVKALSLIGKPAVPALLELLADENRTTRNAAESALHGIGEPVVPLLAAALDKAPHFTTRSGAARILGKIGASTSIPHLLKALQDQHLEVRQAAALALGDFDDPRIVPPLLLLFREGREYSDRTSAIRSLAAIGERSVIPDLIAAARSDSRLGVRNEAISALAKLQAQEAVIPLIDMIDDENITVRENVYKALGEISDRRALEPLINAMRTEQSEHRRMNIAVALGALGDSQALPVLHDAIEREINNTLVRAAIEAVGKIGDPQSIPLLLKTFDGTEDTFVKRSVQSALAGIGDPAIVPLMAIIAGPEFMDRDKRDRDRFISIVGDIIRVSFFSSHERCLEWWQKNKTRYPAAP